MREITNVKRNNDKTEKQPRQKIHIFDAVRVDMNCWSIQTKQFRSLVTGYYVRIFVESMRTWMWYGVLVMQ